MSVSISLVRTLLEGVAHAGADPERLLSASRFDRDLLDDPNARIDTPAYDALQELALELTGDPALGLHMGDQPSVAAFQVVGHLVSHCRTLREGIDVFFRYHRIVADCAASYLEPRGDDVVLVYNYLRTTPRCTRLRAEFGIARLLRIGQMFGGVAKVPRDVWFEHAEPEYAAEYRRIFAGSRVHFGQPSTGIVMPAAFLDLAQLHPNPDLYRVLEAQADKQLSALDTGAPLAQRIHALVVHHFAEVEPNMDTVARRLAMSSRSLRRKLQAEGVSFTAVIDAAMGELAKNVLSEPNTTIHEAGFRLGFSEPSSFHRAFKRWTGLTPKQFRERLQRTPR